VALLGCVFNPTMQEHKNGKTEGEYGYTGRSAHATLHIINGAARP